MYQKLKSKLIVAGLTGLALTSSLAHAIPTLEDVRKLVEFQRKNGTIDTTTVIADNENGEVVYVPWDAVALVNDTRGKPMFGFAYTEMGGKINMVVKAGYSPDTKAKIKELTDSGYVVRPVPVIAGTWSVVGYDLELGMNRTVTSGSVSTKYFETVFPTSPIGLSVRLNADDLKLMVGLLQTGASMVLNYSYSFRAATPKTKFEMTINQSRVDSIIEESLQRATRKCVKTPSGGADIESCNPDGFKLEYDVTADGSKTINYEKSTFSNLEIENLNRIATETQAVKVNSFGLSALEQENARKLAEKYIQSVFFTPVTIEGFPDNAVAKGQNGQDLCKIEGHPCKTVECQGYSQSYKRRALSSNETVEKTFTMESWGTQILQGHVGFALSSICRDIPNYVVYVPGDGSPIKKGCPTSWPVVKKPSAGERVDAEEGGVETDPAGDIWGSLIPRNVPNPSSNGSTTAGDFGSGSLKKDPTAPISKPDPIFGRPVVD